MVRAATIWGDARIADAAARRLLMVEWHDAFRFYTFAQVDGALTVLRDSLGWWPKVSEVLAAIRAALPKPGLPTAEREVSGTMTPEELERRRTVISEAHRRYGTVSADVVVNEWEQHDPVVYEVPVSDVTPALRARLGRRVGGER
jgi:hypothetical protein